MPILILLFLLLAQCTTSTEAPAPEEKRPAEAKVNREEIRAAIGAHKNYLSECYSKTLITENGAKLKGTVMVRFLVGPDGRAVKPEVIDEKTTLKNDKLNECLFAGLTSWDFPVSPDGDKMDIRFPFFFSDAPPAGMQKKMDKFEKLRNH